MVRVMMSFATAFVAVIALAQQAAPPTAEELAAISQRGRMLNEYDQAVWHATDAVQMANPKTVEGQKYIAAKENGRWTVVFGKLNEDRSRFAITYEGIQKPEKAREFVVEKQSPEREDAGFFLYAARAIGLALKDFSAANRPYNIAVLPAPADQLYVYLYPAQTKARVYPLGGDVRYLVSADGSKILEKRQMHKSILETAPSPKGTNTVAGFHSHVLSDLPEDTDVFHVLTQDPPLPEMVGTAHFRYQVLTDGSIRVEEGRKKKK